MPAVQQWGRKGSMVWPSRHYLYTLGALFLSLVLTGFLVYVGFHYGLSPLERYYLHVPPPERHRSPHASSQYLSPAVGLRRQIAGASRA
jgi:hypothetical protein